MFEYLDVFARTLVEKLSREQIYNMQNDPDSCPAFKSFLLDQKFWFDLCLFHFKKSPINVEDSKQFFAAEHLFMEGRFEEASVLNHPMALFKLIEKKLQTSEYDAALVDAQTAINTYGVLGSMFYIHVCQSAVSKIQDKSLKSNYAMLGLSEVESIKSKSDDENAMLYLKNSDWIDSINKNYGGYSKYIEMGKTFFEKHMPEPGLKLK